MEFDALLLSRIQFAFTMPSTSSFPLSPSALRAGSSALEFNWLRTGDPLYRNLFRFWVKVFAVSFGLGVVSGIVMSYQFGTNWSRFSEFTGNVLGPVIAYEVITAFFLEAAFLGIMLFGWEKVGDRLHFFATCMVALGTLISAFWILSANSWMQTPDGFAIENGKAVPVDWFEIVFNPSFPLRYAHMVMRLLSHDRLRGRRHVGLDAAAPSARCAGRSSPARAAPCPWRCGSPRSSCRCRSSSAICTASACSSSSRRSSRRSRATGTAGQHAAAPLRAARRGGGDEPLRDRDPEDRQLGSDARLRRDRAGPQGRAAGRAAAGLAGLLLLPRHGRHRLRDARHRPVEPVPAL